MTVTVSERGILQHLTWGDRGRLESPIAPALEEARELLRQCGIAFSRIVSADWDSVLFRDQAGKPMTAWIRTFADRIEVTPADGFQAVKVTANDPRYWHKLSVGAPEFDDGYVDYEPGRGDE